jgi:hypothetical protein
MDRKAGPFSFPLPDNSLELTGTLTSSRETREECTGRENSMMRSA